MSLLNYNSTTEGIFIDDTGTPGVESSSNFLPESRKSWVAVIITPNKSEELNRMMGIFTKGVKEDYSANELHFTDIYSGRKEWKEVSIEKRKEIFDFMLGLFEVFDLPVYIQTWSNEYFKDHKELKKNLKKISTKIHPDYKTWRLTEVDHFGLYLLLSRLRYCINEHSRLKYMINKPLRVYADQGLASSGKSFKIIPGKLKNIYHDEKINFVSSQCNFGIQIADFAAFVIGRQQWIISKKKSGTNFSEADKHILEIIGKLNTLNMKKNKISDETFFSKEIWENYLTIDRINKKLPPIPK